MKTIDPGQSLKHRLLLAISAGALLAASGCGGSTRRDESVLPDSGGTGPTGGTSGGATSGGGTSSPPVQACEATTREFCLTNEAMESQARYGYGQIPRDPPRTDAEVAGGYDANGCMRHDWVATSCCNPGLDPGARVGDKCCYWACDAGCCGRPFVLAGQVITAPAVCRDDWLSSRLDSFDTCELAEAWGPAPALAALAVSWQAAALAEHASVASFARFTLQLLALGAPSELVLGAQQAALDEIDHAQRCFAIASRLGGQRVGPGPLAQAGASLATDMAEVVVATIHEGCVGETLAAALASEQARVAVDPEVRASLLKIAEDEARHAELAWRFVAWALQGAEPRVRRLAHAAFSQALERTQRPPEPPLCAALDPALLHAWGQLALEESAALVRRTLDEVIRPAEQLLLSQKTSTSLELSAGV